MFPVYCYGSLVDIVANLFEIKHRYLRVLEKFSREKDNRDAAREKSQDRSTAQLSEDQKTLGAISIKLNNVFLFTKCRRMTSHEKCILTSPNHDILICNRAEITSVSVRKSGKVPR